MDKNIKAFKKRWFAPRNETTIMNWSGLIKGNEGFFDLIFGNYETAEEIEQWLKEDLWKYMIEPELKKAYKLK